MKRRNKAIDMMKGWIAILMTCSHLLGITSYYLNHAWIRTFITYVNLTTFSGFMFCFGYVCYDAYIMREDKMSARRNLLKGAVKTLMAFYISSICMILTIGNHRGIIPIIKVLLFRTIPTLSEFLISFFLIYVLLFLFIENLHDFSDYKIAIGIFLSLISTFFPYDIVSEPLLGSIIGTEQYCCFPLVQYSAYFFGGMWLAKQKRIFSKRILCMSVLGTTVYLLIYFIQGVPMRFPPSIGWILGGAAFVYGYFLIFSKLDELGKEIKQLSFLGKHTLLILLIGNVTYFLLRFITKDTIQTAICSVKDIWKYTLCVLSVIGVSVVMIKITERKK